MRWPSAIVLLGVALHFLRLAGQFSTPAEPPRFEAVADGLYILTQWLRILPVLPALPISVYLVQEGSKWGLVDAGLPSSRRQPHADQLLAALQQTIPEGDSLAAIILTHAHPDHVGALPLLLAAYPDTPVVAHELEGPYLTGGETYVPPGGLQTRAGRWAGLVGNASVTVPPQRLHLLQEPLSDLSLVSLESLVYVVTFGHSPGHISLLHGPSNTMLAGDALSFLTPSVSLGRPADANDTRVVSTLPPLTLRAGPTRLCLLPSCDKKQLVTSLCLLADGLRYDRLLASHDWGRQGRGGWTQGDMQTMAAGFPQCVELRKANEAGEDGEDGEGGEYGVEEEEAAADEYE